MIQRKKRLWGREGEVVLRSNYLTIPEDKLEEIRIAIGTNLVEIFFLRIRFYALD